MANIPQKIYYMGNEYVYVKPKPPEPDKTQKEYWIGSVYKDSSVYSSYAGGGQRWNHNSYYSLKIINVVMSNGNPSWFYVNTPISNNPSFWFRADSVGY